MVWVGGALDMKSGSGESESSVEDYCSEGMLLLVVGAVVTVPAGEGRRRLSWQRSVRAMSLSVRRWRLWRTREGGVVAIVPGWLRLKGGLRVFGGFAA